MNYVRQVGGVNLQYPAIKRQLFQGLIDGVSYKIIYIAYDFQN